MHLFLKKRAKVIFGDAEISTETKKANKTHVIRISHLPTPDTLENHLNIKRERIKNLV